MGLYVKRNLGGSHSWLVIGRERDRYVAESNSCKVASAR
jgi:hypothetical protein